MNVKITSRHELLAGFWWSQLEFNRYQIEIDLLTATRDIVEQNIAFLRMRYIIEDALANVVFVQHTETEVIESLTQAGVQVAVTPEEPVDQIIGMILHSKLSAVTEGRVIVRSVRLSSTKGDDIVYEHDDAEFNPLMEQAGWWSNLEPDDVETVGDDDRISVITAGRHWRDLDMPWSETEESDSTENVVVFGEFRRDED